VTQDDLLYRFRLRTFATAAELGTVRAACRAMGIHPSTFYRWKHQLDRHGPEVLRPRERRVPQMANQTSVLVEQRVVAFALGHPGFGPARIAAELARPKWGEISLSANGVWRVLRRHGLSTRAKRYGLGSPATPPHRCRNSPRRRRSGTCTSIIQVSWSSWTGSASAGCRHQGDGVAVHRHRRGLGLHLGHPAGDQAQPLSCLDQRPCPEGRRRPGRPRLAAGAGHDNASEFRAATFGQTMAKLKSRHSFIRAGRPQTNGCVERVQQTILEECWKPAFARYLIPKQTGLRLDLERYLRSYNTERAHSGHWTKGRTPDEVLGKAKLWQKKR
jgi:transposase InsO family protein